MLADRRVRISRRRRRLTAGAVLAAAALAAPAMGGNAAASASTAGSSAGGTASVSYRGHTFQAPRSWPVIRLSRHPRACVRFDRHAVYLGRPGSDQNCPPRLVGATEALLVQPAPRSSRTRAWEDPVARRIQAVAPGIRVTATYGANRALVERILSSASLPTPTVTGPREQIARPGSNAGASFDPPMVADNVTNATGKGFDTCAAPSEATMNAWRKHSSYQAVGVYIGGSDRACAQPNLTARWISQEAKAGWRFIPLYVGPQASFGEIHSPVSQAASAAKDAAAQARALGLGARTVLYYDMESYQPKETAKALPFLSEWTTELHALGYRSGIYSSSLSGVADLARNYANPSYTMPDVIYDAWWNGVATTKDPNIPSRAWANRRRVHQYSGNVTETYGGDQMTIDQDYLDVQLPVAGGTPQASQAAARRDGVIDAFYRGSGGKLWDLRYQPSLGWSSPVSLGGSPSAQPTAVTMGSGNVVAFFKGANGHLWGDASTNTGGWSGPRDLGMGRLGTPPRAVSQGNGVIDVFWRGSNDRHLWDARYRPGGGWSGPHRLGGDLASWPSPAVSDAGVVSVFWKGPHAQLWHTLRGAGRWWRRPADLGKGPLWGPPRASAQTNGEIDVFWRGPRGHTMWRTKYTHRNGWTARLRIATGVAGNPFLVASSPGAVSAFWKGAHGDLWYASNDKGAGWRHAVRLATMGSPGKPLFASGERNGRVDVFWRGSADPHLWHARYHALASAWTGPGDLGGKAG